jgi:hypothetical protein
MSAASDRLGLPACTALLAKDPSNDMAGAPKRLKEHHANMHTYVFALTSGLHHCPAGLWGNDSRACSRLSGGKTC